jgi:hypothetical protein
VIPLYLPKEGKNIDLKNSKEGNKITELEET